MQEIRIKVEDGIPYGIALDLVASCFDGIGEDETHGRFGFANKHDDIKVYWRKNKCFIFEVCKTRLKTTE